MNVMQERVKKRMREHKWKNITKRDGTLSPKDRVENALRARQAHIAEQGV